MMESKFLEYLQDIGMTEAHIERIKTLIQTIEFTCSEKIEDILVSEYLEKDGTRIFESLELFSKSYFMAANRFLSEDDYAIFNPRHRIGSFDVKLSKYDLTQAAAENSVLIVVVHFPTLGIIRLKASGKNCNYLKEILIKHIRPRLIENNSTDD